MAYTKTNWQNLPNTTTPLNATNHNKIENQLEVLDKSLKYMGVAPDNLNNAKDYGIYHLSGTHTNAPISSAIYGVLIVYQNRGENWNPSSSSWIWQELRTTTGLIYVRHATNTESSWSAWENLAIKKVIFESSLDAGNTSETITLNESIANFKEIEINYSYGTNAYATKKVLVKGTTVPASLDVVFCGSSNIQIMSAVVSLNGTTLTRTRVGAKNISISNNTIANFDNPTIAIHRIVGIR